MQVLLVYMNIDVKKKVAVSSGSFLFNTECCLMHNKLRLSDMVSSLDFNVATCALRLCTSSCMIGKTDLDDQRINIFVAARSTTYCMHIPHSSYMFVPAMPCRSSVH